MKGVVFDVVRDVVCAEYSVTAWDRILLEADVDGVYTSLGTYPDEELSAIVASASRVTGLPADELLRWLGRLAFPRLAVHIPETIFTLDSWQDLLAGLDRIIHAEVTRVYPDAVVPGFVASAAGTGVVQLRYQSERGLCALADGLVVGAGEWFDSELVVRHVRCVHRGDSECLLEVTEQAG